MLTTGLLSLNIHEALTFDGTELCLHPDLFVSEPGSSNNSQQTRATLSQKNTDDPKAGTSSGFVAGAQSVAPLAVGDMIEIRVWDPLPKETTKSPNASVLRKPRQSPPTTVTSTAAATTTVTATTTAAVPVELQTTQASTTSGRPRTSISTTAGSLQYSESDACDADTDQNDASTTASSIEKSLEKEANMNMNSNSTSNSASNSTSTSNSAPTTSDDQLPPTKNVITTPALPPVFPRGRANTNDVAKSLKPPPLHRRMPSTSSTIHATVPSQKSPKLTRHSREISDMTIDTHQLDTVDLQQTESIEDDGDDNWSKVNTTHKLRLSFVLLVTEKTLTTLKGNTRTQVSMLRQVADLYKLSSYDMVTIHKIEPQDEPEVLQAVSADFLLVTIKDQFISRGDMHFFQNALVGSWVYEGQRLSETTRGVKAHAREIRHGNFSAKSGIVTDKTMITFRSRSARIIWLVQLSCEMWDYTSPYEHQHQPESVCEIYFDQWIRFIYKLFAKWKELEVTHSLTVVFFSRTFLTNGRKSSLDCRDIYGRSFEDHYKTIIENETYSDWDLLVVRIKEEFIKYPLEVGWNSTDRRPSNASQGNVLEAINVTLNLMQFHFLDRDLHRTGNSIVVISPGCGVFEVDKGLAGITYQRMMDNGIGSDMLSLGLPPLHIAPFFLYNNEYRSVETRGVDTSETYYEVPHWMHLSFINYDREESHHNEEAKRQASGVNNLSQLWLDSFEVAANGVLRPRKDTSLPHDPHSPTMKPKSPTSTFSALGNAAATPGKAKSTRERQLISGRNFRDILEATAPRISGINMPSALSSLLRLKQVVEDVEKAKLSGIEWTGGKALEKHVPLREWGTVDFQEFGVRPLHKSNRHEGGNVCKLSIDLNDKSEGSESGSASSSFASQISSMFGMSYDRVLWGQLDSPVSAKKALQIQRSPSLEFEKLDDSHYVDSDTALSEDSMSVSTDNGSRISGGQGEDAAWTGDHDTNESRQTKREKHAENLKRIMAARDAKFFAPLPLKVDPTGDVSLVRPDTTVSSDSDLATTPKTGILSQNLWRGKEAKPSGGLGAALSQYSGSDDPSLANPDGHSAKRITRISSTGQFQVDRSRTASPMFPVKGHIQDRGSLALSPMLIPPMGQAHTNADPPDVVRQSDTGAGNSSRFLPPESRGLHSREGQGPLGLPSGIDHGDQSGVFNQPMSASALTNMEYGRPKIPQGTRSPPGVTAGRSKIKIRAHSPPSGGMIRNRSSQRPSGRDHQSGNHKQPLGSRRKKAFNPFRQSDEDEVLAKRSHNRRRWSHVFPVGEVEFKRHAGPNWNSLTSPAILPLSVDYFPSSQELRDESTFQFSPYTVTLGGLDKKHYSSHAELLMEMVRQRLTQDFQVVTAAAVEESENRAEAQRQVSQYAGRNNGKPQKRANGRRSFARPPTIKHDNSSTIKHYLTMGHRIQVLNYDPSSDIIEIVHYNKKSAQNDAMNVYTYRFLLFSKGTEEYSKSIQTFKKYADPYKWNKVDNLICGEEDRTMEEGMRFRRVGWLVIPDEFKDVVSEQEYIAKFQRLVEYLSKLREKEDPHDDLDIKIVSSADEKLNRRDEVMAARRGTSDAMVRFTVQLRKGKRDPFEWIEIAVDSTFDTARSYRIMLNWLVASSAKVETQVQLLHRRCTQYGLQLTSFPQATISRNLFLNPFVVPPTICVRDSQKADLLDKALLDNLFADDGIQFTDIMQVLRCIDSGEEFDFPKYRSGKVRHVPARQFVHRSGTLFVRKIRDRQGWAIIVVIENSREASRDGFRESVQRILREVSQLATSHGGEERAA